MAPIDPAKNPDRAKHHSVIAISVVLALAASCGGSSPTSTATSPTSTASPGDNSFPVRVSTGGTCFPAGIPESAIFFVTGFSSRVTTPTAAPPLEVLVKVGERVKLGLQLQGCGFENAESWSSQNMAVGVVTQDPTFSSDAEFLAVSPGATTVFVDFSAMDNKRHRTTLGYCDLDALYPGYPDLGPCENPKLIGTVRVVQ
jgi:hypothetical protein